MPETRLEPDGRLPLPKEVVEALGWTPGDTLEARAEGDMLLVQRSTPAASLREEARRLASAMRDLTQDTTRRLSDTVAQLREQVRPASPNPERPAPATGPHVGAFQGVRPQIPESAYLAPGSTVVGDVALGEDASVWPGAVLRGDVAAVRVGARSNVQEGAVLHVSPQVPCRIGSGVTIGHQATVHACTVGDDTLIGIQAVVLDGAQIGRHCIVAAGAVVPPGMTVPDGKMVMGVPAKVVRDLTAQEIERIRWNADSYVSLKNAYLRPAAGPPPVIPPEPKPRPEPPARGALPRYECRRASGRITVDGALDDPGWSAIAPLSPLVRVQDGGPAQQPTEVRACWDDAHLYVAFSCKDTDIRATYENRDDPLYDEEVVELFLCPTGDLRHYFEIELSPKNVLFDARVFSPEGDRRAMLVDRDWNAMRLRSAVRLSGTLNDSTSPDVGWIAELAIPFADLGLSGPPADGAVWRVNFYRIDRGEEAEFTAWSPTYREPADFHVPACFGELVFRHGETEEAV